MCHLSEEKQGLQKYILFLYSKCLELQTIVQSHLPFPICNLYNGFLPMLTGTWENKFPVELTHKRSFRVNDKLSVKVPMMQTKANFLAATDDELECGILQLPYVGNISMLIVLPHKPSGMNTLEKQLTPQVVERWQKSMTNR